MDRQNRPWKIEFILNNNQSETNLVTSAAVFAFNQEKLLLTKHSQDCWILPDGHLEAGETAAEAIVRETKEETSCTMNNIKPFGHISLSLFAPKPANYSYPYPTRHCMVYTATVTAIHPFQPQPDATDRGFFSSQQLHSLANKSMSLQDDLNYFGPHTQPTVMP